jgi:hypothetical protein
MTLVSQQKTSGLLSMLYADDLREVVEERAERRAHARARMTEPGA